MIYPQMLRTGSYDASLASAPILLLKNLTDPSGLCSSFDGGDCGGGGIGIGFGDPWSEDPGVPAAQGPAHTASHTPFPIPGQGFDWRNFLFGPPGISASPTLRFGELRVSSHAHFRDIPPRVFRI